LNKTEVQLDAILEAYAEDYPKKLKFERRGAVKDVERVGALSVQWTRRLIGDAREELRKKYSFKIPEPFKRERPNVRQPPATNQAKPKVVRMPTRPTSKR